MVKFRTQFRKSREGNLHFTLLGLSFGKNQFMVTTLGVVIILTFKSK